MRIVSFNILHGQPVTGLADTASGGDTERHGAELPKFTDINPLASAIRELNPDVLALQEVDVHQERSGGHHEMAVAADAMGAIDWRFIPTALGTPGPGGNFTIPTLGQQSQAASSLEDFGPQYGIGLAARVPVHQWRATALEPSKIKLPLLVQTDQKPKMMSVPDEPRGAISIETNFEGRDITIATVHLSFVPGRNVRQLRLIRRWLANLPRPLILIGDFNLPGRIPKIVTGYTELLAEPTFPSYKPKVQFDHILVDGLEPTAVKRLRNNVEVHRMPISDHCAVALNLDSLTT